jgi:hypothetical protein
MTTYVTVRSFGVYHELAGRTAAAAVHKALGRNVNPVPLAELTDEQRAQFLPWWGTADREQYGEAPWGAAVNTVYGGEVKAVIAAVSDVKHDAECEVRPGGAYYGRTVKYTNPPMQIPCHCVAREQGRKQAQRRIHRVAIDGGSYPQVERYRINDHVGAPIWGIRLNGAKVQEGDRVWFEDRVLFPGRAWMLTVTRVDGRLATRYDHGGFCGFITG